MAHAATAHFQPKFAHYAERVRASFARQGAMRHIGAELLDVRPGYCAIALPVRPELSQQHGYVHAGMVSAIVDAAAPASAPQLPRYRLKIAAMKTVSLGRMPIPHMMRA